MNDCAKSILSTSACGSLFVLLMGSIGFAATDLPAGHGDAREVSPFAIAGPADELGVTPLRWLGRAYEELKGETLAVRMRFPLAADRFGILDLQRFEVFAPDVVLVARTPAGDIRLPPPNVLTFSGAVAGEQDSHVFLSLSPHGSNGMVTVDGQTYVLSAKSPGRVADAFVYEWDAVAEEAIDWVRFVCHADELLPARPLPVGGAVSAFGPPCRVAEVAIETDYEYTQNLFGGNVGAASAYVATLIGAVSDIYLRDFNAKLLVTFVGLWTIPGDPWNRGDTTNQLFQFRDYWEANMGHVQRHDAHFLSGRPLGGGVAWLPGLCIAGFNYALSANLSGFFPLPLQHNHPQNWDPYVVAHEFGHNFGAPHTHDMVPPVDRCAFGQCQGAANGTIMSYCHLCAGGVGNIRMEFAERTIQEAVLPYLDQTECDLTGHPDCAEVAALPDEFSVLRGNHVGGVLADLFDSDDQYVMVDAGLTLLPNEPPVWLELEATVPTVAPAGLTFRMESRVNTPNRVQTIALFNFDSNTFEVIDVRTAGGADSIAEVAVVGDPARFVDAPSGLMRAQVSWQGAGLVLLFPWTVSIDQIVWLVQE